MSCLNWQKNEREEPKYSAVGDGLNEVANSPRVAYSAVFKDDTDVYFSHVKKNIPILLTKAGEKTPCILFLELNRYVNMYYVCILKSLQGWSLE